MNITKFEIEHKYNIGDIIELKNKNNNKSIFGIVDNISLSFDFGSISNIDIIKYSKFQNLYYRYKLFYTIITQPNSYYDTEEIMEFPQTTLLLNLE